MKLFLPIIDNGMGLSRTSWALSLAAACLTVLHKHDVVLRSISYPYPDRAMNIATHEFLKSKCDEMLVIDTDVVFEPHHLIWLFEHNEPLVFGMYPKKVPGLHFPIELLDGENPFAQNPHEAENPLAEVKRCARGFMRVHRSVFERMLPDAKLDDEGVPVIWQNFIGGQGEDFNFCDAWRDLGGKVLVDQRITTKHDGSALYPIPGTY